MNKLFTEICEETIPFYEHYANIECSDGISEESAKLEELSTNPALHDPLSKEEMEDTVKEGGGVRGSLCL